MLVSICSVSVYGNGNFNINEKFIYVDDKGNAVEYYVDENGYEYVYRNGEKIFILLPLEKYLSSAEDVEIQNEIYTQPITVNSVSNEAKKSYVIISTLYNYEIKSGGVTGALNYPANADCLRLKTTDFTPWYVGKLVNVHLYVTSRDGGYYIYHYFDQNCCITQGFALNGDFASKVNVGIVSVDGFASCNLAVTATAG